MESIIDKEAKLASLKRFWNNVNSDLEAGVPQIVLGYDSPEQALASIRLDIKALVKEIMNYYIAH